MPIRYDRLLAMLAARGVTSYTIKRDKVIGQASLAKIRAGGHIDTRTIESLCRYLQCQPGDILEYRDD